MSAPGRDHHDDGEHHREGDVATAATNGVCLVVQLRRGGAMAALAGAFRVAVERPCQQGDHAADHQHREDAGQHERRDARALRALRHQLRRHVGRLARFRTCVGTATAQRSVKLEADDRPQAVDRTSGGAQKQHSEHAELQRLVDTCHTNEASQPHGKFQGILLLGFFGTNGAT